MAQRHAVSRAENLISIATNVVNPGLRRVEFQLCYFIVNIFIERIKMKILCSFLERACFVHHPAHFVRCGSEAASPW